MRRINEDIFVHGASIAGRVMEVPPYYSAVVDGPVPGSSMARDIRSAMGVSGGTRRQYIWRSLRQESARPKRHDPISVSESRVLVYQSIEDCTGLCVIAGRIHRLCYEIAVIRA